MNKIYDTLNDMQQMATFHTDGPLLILAGAGSGKTRVLTHRIAYLIEEKSVNPYNIMAITFTNKAAAEMRSRVNKIVGFGAEQVWVSTFHSACVRILRRYIDRIGYSTDFTIYDIDDQKRLIKNIIKELNLNTKIYKENAMLGKISDFKNKLITTGDVAAMARNDFKMVNISKIYDEYQEALKKNNALDFDDLIMKTVQLFNKCPEVLEGYQNRLQYIMVDEYQDTNAAQFAFIKQLASKNQNLCVVGDDDQSIYKFRGANIGNILGFEKVFSNAKVIRLEQNYRSTQNILNAANQVIQNNMERKRKTLWTENEEGEKLHFRQFMNAYEEAEYVVGEISKKVREGDGEYRDFAVLYRTNAQSRLFEEKLLMANIPYKLVGGVNFYARKEIKDLLAYLKTVDNAKDDLAVRRIINVPKRGIGATTLSRVQDYASERGIGFYDALREAEQIPSIGRAAVKVEPFVTFIQTLRSKQEFLSPSELLKDIIESTGYVEELRNEGTDEAEARIENIDELITKVVSYEEENEAPTLSGFLEEVALVADIDSVDGDDNQVLLMTLHSAKGLEFPYVYLAGMEDGIFPSYMTITADDPTEIEEERRLCYVGITRAMKELTLSCAQQRMIRGETQYNKVSRFIKEIPRELVELGREFPEKKLKEIPMPTSYQQMKQAFKQPAFIPKQFEVKKAQGLDYGVGDTVKHIKFGAGVVTDITEGGRDYEVTVNFDKVGVKKMFASFAKLKKFNRFEKSEN